MKNKYLYLAILSSVMLSANAMAFDNPCEGPTALLNVIDRPTVGDSACVVPVKKAVLEMGYQYMELTHSAGHAQNLPEAVLRIGLPRDTEFVILLPNYIHQSLSPTSGYTATTLGIKHEVGYTPTWVAALEGLVTLPNGSAAFGSKQYGSAFNGIISYALTPQFNLTLMLGASTQIQPSSAGGERYSSVNPDVVFTYAPMPVFNIYAEVYGQSRTSPTDGKGFNSDAGIVYLALPYLALDLEVGRRISGDLIGFNQYVGTGLSVMFG